MNKEIENTAEPTVIKHLAVILDAQILKTKKTCHTTEPLRNHEGGLLTKKALLKILRNNAIPKIADNQTSRVNSPYPT